MALGSSYAHGAVKRSARKSVPLARRWSSWATQALEVLIALAIGLAITWFLATVSISG